MELKKGQCASTPTQIGEEEFIELEMNPKVFSAAASNTKSSSPPDSREFEFQMSSSHHLHATSQKIPSQEAATSPSPADDLFYKGNLLPLHLPPRLQMVQKLLQQTSIHNMNPSTSKHQTSSELKGEDETLQIQPVNPIVPLITTKSFTAPPTISNTPLESCNISPTESCRVSCELNPDEHFFHWSTTESTAFIGFNNIGGCGNRADGGQQARKSWSRKLRMMKPQPSSLTQKLRAASRAYLKSLFLTSKSACSDEANCSSNNSHNPDEEDGRREAWNMLKAREYVNRYIKIVKKMNYPFGQTENLKPQQHPQQKQVMSTSSFTMKSFLDREIMTDDDNQTTFTCHRRSFSGAIKRHCTSKCYSSSSSSSSTSQSLSSNCSSSSSSNSTSFSLPKSANGYYEINLLKRSTSANSELENSVEGAIAHCKKSHQMKMECLVGNGTSGPQQSDQQQLGSCLLSASRAGRSNKRTELGRI